jgi:hypothetical protein
MKTLGLVLAILIYLAFIAFWFMLFIGNEALSIITGFVIGIYVGVKSVEDAYNFYQWVKSNLK